MIKITHNLKPYLLDEKRAIELGVLTPEPPKRDFALSSDEAAVLYTILSYVGGSSMGARGVSDELSRRIRSAFNGAPKTTLNLSVSTTKAAIYFDYP